MLYQMNERVLNSLTPGSGKTMNYVSVIFHFTTTTKGLKIHKEKGSFS